MRRALKRALSEANNHDFDIADSNRYMITADLYDDEYTYVRSGDFYFNSDSIFFDDVNDLSDKLTRGQHNLVIRDLGDGFPLDGYFNIKVVNIIDENHADYDECTKLADIYDSLLSSKTFYELDDIKIGSFLKVNVMSDYNLFVLGEEKYEGGLPVFSGLVYVDSFSRDLSDKGYFLEDNNVDTSEIGNVYMLVLDGESDERFLSDLYGDAPLRFGDFVRGYRGNICVSDVINETHPEYGKCLDLYQAYRGADARIEGINSNLVSYEKLDGNKVQKMPVLAVPVGKKSWLKVVLEPEAILDSSAERKTVLINTSKNYPVPSHENFPISEIKGADVKRLFDKALENSKQQYSEGLADDNVVIREVPILE